MTHAPESQSPGIASSKLTICRTSWSKVDLQTRLFTLDTVKTNLKRVARFWVEEEAELRGHAPTSDAGAESWLLGPLPVARMLRHLENGLRSGGRPRLPSLRLRVDGRCISRVFPYGFHEGLLFWGNEAHVWSVGSDIQGEEYRRVRDLTPGAALVLGASNVSAISVTDVLSKLFCENRPVVCKVPERFEPLVPIFQEIFYPLIRNRHLQFLCGGADLGTRLLSEPDFSTVHLTGSIDTFRVITANNPVPQRTFTAELGCVTPLIIVPGEWTRKELEYQARHLVSLLVFNGGYNCVTPQTVIVSQGWTQKGEFLDLLRSGLEKASRRDDNFPGSRERRSEFRKAYPKAEVFGPRTLVELEPQTQELLFDQESFCGMLGWAELDEARPDRFLDQAVRFANQRLYGDLSCVLLVDPRTRKDYEQDIARNVTRLEYGTVCLNVWGGLGFATSVTPWGSYRGGNANTGTGWVHNTFFYDKPEKTVLEGPFVPLTPVPWVKPFPNLYRVGRDLFHLDLEPNPRNLIRFARSYGSALLKLKRRQDLK